MSFFGRILGGIYILYFPSQKPKKSYVISCYLTSFFLCLIPMMSLVPFLSKEILLFSMFASGFCRSYIIVMNMIVSENIDSEENKKALNIWGSLFFLGDPLIVFLSYSLLNNFNISWQKSFLIIVSLFTFITLTIQLYLPEIDMGRLPQQKQLEEPEQEYVE